MSHLEAFSLKPKIAVLMLTKNSGKWLNDVLYPIKKQQSDFDVNLILVDGFSMDDTLSKARYWFPNLILVQSKSRNFAELRNIALEKAKDLTPDYMAFIDSDMQVPSNFFSRMIKLLDNPKVGIVGLRFELEKDPPKHFVSKFYRGRTDIARKGVFTTDYTTTACSMWKAELSKNVVLDERLKRAGEDVDFNLQITEQGYTTLVDANDPPAWHIRPATVREELHRVKDHGLARALLMKTHNKGLSKNRRIKTSLASCIVACGWIGLFLIPRIHIWGLIPFAGLFFRQWTKTKQKWRIDYSFFGFLMSIIYFTRFLQGVGQYWVLKR